MAEWDDDYFDNHPEATAARAKVQSNNCLAVGPRYVNYIEANLHGLQIQEIAGQGLDRVGFIGENEETGEMIVETPPLNDEEIERYNAICEKYEPLILAARSLGKIKDDTP